MSQQNNPAWVPVDSSAITALAYDSGTQTLYARFIRGEEYAYSNVTAAEHAALVNAESVGKFFNQYIKPTHEYRKLGVTQQK